MLPMHHAAEPLKQAGNHIQPMLHAAKVLCSIVLVMLVTLLCLYHIQLDLLGMIA